MSHSSSHHSTEEEEPSEDMASSIRPLNSYPRASSAHSRSPSPAPAPPAASIRRTARMSVRPPVRISLGPLPRALTPVREPTYHLSGDPYRPPSAIERYTWNPHDIIGNRAGQQGESSRAAIEQLAREAREMALDHERRLRIYSSTRAYDCDSLAQFEQKLDRIDVGMGRVIPHVYKNAQENIATKKTANQARDLGYCNTVLIVLIFVVLASMAFGRSGH